MGEVRVGTSGFSFNDWIGEVYPKDIKKEEMLPFYEKKLGFNALEINYTYYSMPTQRTFDSFSKRTSDDFLFSVKAYKGFTHEKEGDLKKLGKLFRDGIGPLKEKVKAILFQFPFSFTPNKENIDYLKRLREEFDGFNGVIEFRNGKWSDDTYIETLKSVFFGYCVVDEPKLKGLFPFKPVLTSNVGYFRFHGRNREWFNVPSEVRYDYLYSEEELAEFVEPVLEVGRMADMTFVFFNNCHLGKAVKNGQMFKEMIEKKY
ncbi:MAG: DUF72 domain-containing protein [Syntrophorhabdaceae bacterium]|nr:DUF72 domain-containing protein [Syntrophorhabdaceae bacterium]